jgi:amino-acid N-acetyltransferase
MNPTPLAMSEESIEQSEVIIREARREDASAIMELLEPYVQQRKLLRRSLEEIAELTRHGFVALVGDLLVGFAAVEIYSRKLAEVQCLAVRDGYQKLGIGREMIHRVVERARDVGVMEVMAISSSESFLINCGFDYSLPDQKKALFYQLRPRH